MLAVLRELAWNDVSGGGKPKLFSVRLYFEQVGFPNRTLLRGR